MEEKSNIEPYCKCGNKPYNNIEIPIKAKIQVSPLGREYYVSGIDGDEILIRYVDGDREVKRLPKGAVKII